MVDIRTEKELEVVRQVAVLLDAENARLHARLKKLTAEIASLKGGGASQLLLELSNLQEQLDARNREIFGGSSEKRPRLNGGFEKAEKREPKKGHGPSEQPSLPVVVIEHTIPEGERACPSCGGTMEPMGGQCEEFEEIDVVQRRFVTVKHKKAKYRCRCMGVVITAPSPPRLVPGGRYSPGFAVEVAASKYIDHMPLERQVRIMRREGLDATSQTLWDQLEALARRVKPSYDEVIKYVLSSPVICADETRWQVMGKSGTSRWWAWCGAVPAAVFYKILDSRSSDAAKEVLGGYGGVVMADGYGAYDALARGSPGFTLAHCWAHVRRKFVEAEPNYPKECAKVLDLIGELYAVEREVPKLSCDAPSKEVDSHQDLLLKLRAEKSAPVTAEIRKWVFEIRPSVLPSSSIGKAIEYMMGMWPGLTRFLTDPRVPIDNNGAERAMRGVVVGRKNHYGSRSKRGTEVAAIFYTLFETAKLAGVEPKAYLLKAAERAIESPGTATLPTTLLRPTEKPA